MKGNIILVDDDKNLRYSITLGLKINGYSIIGFDSPIPALEYLSNENNIETTDIIISDIQMPKMNGTKFIKILSQRKIKIPILVMTGYGTKDMVIDLMRIGCNDFIDKPFNNTQLLKTINKLVSKAKTEKNIVLASKEKEKNIKKNIIDNFNKNLNSAKKTYENIVSIDTKELSDYFQYKQKFFMDLGGDFLDINKNNKYIDLIVSDVSGHDFGASYQNIIIKSTFVELIDSLIERKNFLHRLNRNLLLNNKTERMATAIYLYLNIEKYELHIFNAGHPYPFFYHNNEFTKISSNGDMLGILEDITVKETIIKVSKKDRIIIYTDGILDMYKYDTQKKKKRKISLTKLEEILSKHISEPLEQFIQASFNDILNFSNQKIVDDTLLTVLEIP